MEYQKIINLIGGKVSDSKLPRYLTKKWVEVYDQSDGTYNVNNDIRFKTPMLRSDLCDYNNAYIIVTSKINVTDPNNNAYDKELALKNNAQFFNCILKIHNTLIEDADDLDIIMPMYNLLYYSKNCRKTTSSLWNYYRDKPNSGYDNDDRDRIYYSIKNSNSFDYKTSIIGKLEGNNTELENIKIVVPLKHLSKFFRKLDVSLINSEVFLNLKWSKNCVLTSKATKNALPEDAANSLSAVDALNNPINAEFLITDCKLYIPVVSLSSENENKLFEQLKDGFIITVK